MKETSGAVTRTTTTTYRPDGLTTSTATRVTGLAGSQVTTDKFTTYDPATGQPTVVTAKDHNGTTVGTITTGYDTWGRQTTYQPSGEQPTTTVYDAAGRTKSVTDPNGATTYTYDGTDANGKTERRGQVTKVDVTTAGSTWTSTGAYDTGGSMTTQKLPGGITRHNHTDNAGEPVGLSYTGQITTLNGDGSTTVDSDRGWLSWSIDNDITGRVAREWTPDGAAFTGNAGSAPGDAIPYDRAYSYDNAGRLMTVKDRTATGTGVDITDPTAAPCITRTYGFDRNDNRLTKSTATSGTDWTCTTTGATTLDRAFDTADRPTTGANGSGNYTYDPLGRTTTLPGTDAPNPADGNVTLGYYDNDLAKSIAQAGTTTTFTLDAADRRATEAITSATGTTQKVRHYADSSDNPTWVTVGTSATRYAELIGGDLSLTVDQTGAADLTLANNHGDVVTTVDLPSANGAATSIAGWNSYDEYGNPINSGHRTCRLRVARSQATRGHGIRPGAHGRTPLQPASGNIGTAVSGKSSGLEQQWNGSVPLAARAVALGFGVAAMTERGVPGGYSCTRNSRPRSRQANRSSSLVEPALPPPDVLAGAGLLSGACGAGEGLLAAGALSRPSKPSGEVRCGGTSGTASNAHRLVWTWTVLGEMPVAPGPLHRHLPPGTRLRPDLGSSAGRLPGVHRKCRPPERVDHTAHPLQPRRPDTTNMASRSPASTSPARGAHVEGGSV